MLFDDFYQLITARIGPAVETFTGVSVPEYDPEIGKTFADPDLFSAPGAFLPVPLYRYMVYLRHHGFPSPLLDWSHSPYVAAFFALRNDLSGKAVKRSIYAFCEKPEGVKGWASDEPAIRRIGPYVRSHRRHFRQQSDYTICGKFDDGYGWRFDSHQRVFDHRRRNQDLLWRFDLSSSERVKVLRMLDHYNLNASSLFDSEETLLEMMWFREHIFRKSGQ